MGRISARNRRRGLAKRLRAPPGAEHRYTQSLRRMMRTLHTEAMKWLEPKLSQIARHDATTPLTSDWLNIVTDLIKGLGPMVSPAFNTLAAAVAKNNEVAMRALGLDVRSEYSAVLEQMRAWNVSLISKAGRSYADDVVAVLGDPETWGKTVDEISSLIEERAKVSESRAELIARDQVSKTNGGLNRYRQTHAGVSSYVWSGSLDERERESHLAKEGHTFDWNAPPADTGHPSEDVQCRCVAIPIIPELDDETEPTSQPTPGIRAPGPVRAPRPPLSIVPAIPISLPAPSPTSPPMPMVAPSPSPRESPSLSEVRKGVHADDIVNGRGVNAKLTDEILRTQPKGAVEALAGRKLDKLEFVKTRVSSRNPPGLWRRFGDGREEIRINTSTPSIAMQRRNPTWSVSTRVALKAADAQRATASTVKKARIAATLTHEIGHQIHNPYRRSPLDAIIDRKIRETFIAAQADGSTQQISRYAATNHNEFFAEAFAAYFHDPSLLDTRARDMVESVLKMRAGP